METLLITMLGVGWTGFLGLLTGVAFGQLVPGQWRERAEGWRISYEREKENSDRQRALVERAQMSTDIADKTAAAIGELMKRSETK